MSAFARLAASSLDYPVAVPVELDVRPASARLPTPPVASTARRAKSARGSPRLKQPEPPAIPRLVPSVRLPLREQAPSVGVVPEAGKRPGTADRQLTVDEHGRRLKEQRNALLSHLATSLSLQQEQAEREQRAVDAEQRAELAAVKEGLGLRKAQLREALGVASEALDTRGAEDAEAAALKEEVQLLASQHAKLQRQCDARAQQAADELLDVRRSHP